MRIVEINGKKRKLIGTLGAIRKITDKYTDYLDMKNWADHRVVAFTYDLMWHFFRWPKPFIFKWRFYLKADLEDMRKAQEAVFSIFSGRDLEDKETKNERSKGKK